MSRWRCSSRLTPSRLQSTDAAREANAKRLASLTCTEQGAIRMGLFVVGWQVER